MVEKNCFWLFLLTILEQRNWYSLRSGNLVNNKKVFSFQAAEKKKKERDKVENKDRDEELRKRKKAEAQIYNNEDYKRNYKKLDKGRKYMEEKRGSPPLNKNYSEKLENPAHQRTSQESDITQKKYSRSHEHAYSSKEEERQKKEAKKKIEIASSNPNWNENKRSQFIPVIPWARENLKVRIIDKHYKQGAFYKQKVSLRYIL